MPSLSYLLLFHHNDLGGVVQNVNSVTQRQALFLFFFFFSSPGSLSSEMYIENVLERNKPWLTHMPKTSRYQRDRKQVPVPVAEAVLMPVHPTHKDRPALQQEALLIRML